MIEVDITKNEVQVEQEANEIEVSQVSNSVSVETVNHEIAVEVVKNEIEITLEKQGPASAWGSITGDIQNQDDLIELMYYDEQTVYQCQSIVKVNDVVYLDNGVLKRASNTEIVEVFGIVKTKITSTSAQIQRFGKRTGFAGLTTGARYYLGVDGGITASPPTTTGTVRVHLGVAMSPSTLYLELNNFSMIN